MKAFLILPLLTTVLLTLNTASASEYSVSNFDRINTLEDRIFDKHQFRITCSGVGSPWNPTGPVYKCIKNLKRIYNLPVSLSLQSLGGAILLEPCPKNQAAACLEKSVSLLRCVPSKVYRGTCELPSSRQSDVPFLDIFGTVNLPYDFSTKVLRRLLKTI